MVAAVQRRESDLDTILKGLQIAHGVFGIKSQIDQQGQLDAQKRLMERKLGLQERELDIEEQKLGQPGEGKTRLIETTDPETGKPVQQIVKDVAGQTFGVPPPKVDAPSSFELGKVAQAEGNKLFANTSAFRDAIDAADEADKLVELAQTNPAAAAAAMRKMARAAGERGVLTDSDVQAFGGSQALADRFEAAIQLAANGTITPENAAFMREVADVMKANSRARIDKQVQSAVTRFKANFGGDDADIRKRLTGEFDKEDLKRVGNGKRRLKATQQEGPPAPAPKMTPGSIIESGGVRYRVGADGETLEEIK